MNTEDMNTGERTWRVGELATATGLSVRALHHYDEIGLLRPSERTTAGHRLYSGADVHRLHRIVALRGFGLSLAEVGQVLDGELEDPRELVRRQLEQLEEQLQVANRLRTRLLGVLDGLDQAEEPSTDKLIDLIEGMTAMRRALTVEELEEMSERRRQAWEAMTPEERAAADEARRQWRDGMSAEELAEVEERRRAMLPWQ